MIARHVTRSIPAAQRRRIHTAAAIAGLAVLLAAGSHAVTFSSGPDAYQPRSAPPTDNHHSKTTDQVLRELRESIARRYGPRPAAPPTVSTDQAMRDYRSTVVKLYGPQPSPSDLDR